MVLENVGALLSKKHECRQLLAYILKARDLIHLIPF